MIFTNIWHVQGSLTALTKLGVNDVEFLIKIRLKMLIFVNVF